MGNNNIIETLKDSFMGVIDRTVSVLPELLVALLLLLIGTIVARYVSKGIGMLVNIVETSQPVKKTIAALGLRQVNINDIIEIFARWTILVIFIGAAVDVLGLSVLTDTFNALLGFVPNIAAAVIVAALSFVAANVLHDLVKVSAEKSNVNAHDFLAKATRIIVLIFGLPLAAAQLGLDLTLINNNITVVVTGIVLAFALAFGLGGRETAGKIVDNLYKNWKK